MGTEALWIPAVLAAVGTGVTAYNADRTAKKQDNALAQQIVGQSRQQADADAKVNEQVRELGTSTAADERAQRLGQYFDIVANNRASQQAGLTPAVGSDRFQAAAADTAKATAGYTGKMADLMSRVDAATLQRQGEGFGYGRLGTDLNLIGRAASGQGFLDQLRASRIKRNPWLDAAAAAANGAGSAYASNVSGGGAGGDQWGAFGPSGGYWQG